MNMQHTYHLATAKLPISVLIRLLVLRLRRKGTIYPPHVDFLTPNHYKVHV